MKAERKETETDLFIDVFFANTLSGRDGDTPVIGQNSNWWIAGKDTGVLAKGKNGNDGNDGQTPSIGANGNWWINGQDTGIKAKAPVISIGSNGHWQIDGVDTAVPTNIDTFLSKTVSTRQSVAGEVFFDSNVRLEHADVRKRACIVSGEFPPESVDGNFEILNIPVNAPHYILAHQYTDGRGVKIILQKEPLPGDMYIVCIATAGTCMIESSHPDVKFWHNSAPNGGSNYTIEHRRVTAILHGFRNRWYVYTIEA